MDLVNAAQRCNDVDVFLVRMREKELSDNGLPRSKLEVPTDNYSLPLDRGWD